MAQLRLHFAEFEQRNAVLLVVGPEDAPAFIKYFGEHDLPFTGLPDPEHKVLDLYGQQFKLLRFGRMPAQVLIDKNGLIRFFCYGQDMTDIPTPTEMLKLVDALNEE
jgi:peroxiredoxin